MNNSSDLMKGDKAKAKKKKQKYFRSMFGV